MKLGQVSAAAWIFLISIVPWGAAALGQSASIPQWAVSDLISAFCPQPIVHQEVLDTDQILDLLDRSSYVKDFPLVLRNYQTLSSIRKSLEDCRGQVTGTPVEANHQRFLTNIKEFLGNFERYDQLQESLGLIEEKLMMVPGLTWRREEWPPNNRCPSCEDDWIAFKQLRDAISEIRRQIVSPRPSDIGAAISAADQSENMMKKACRSIRHIGGIMWSRRDARFKYYSWTETRHSMNQVVEKLRDPVIFRICV